MKLDKLFKQTSSGAIQEWLVETEGNKVVTHFGQLNSPNIQTTSEVVFGKNIGKINETTDEEQAQLRAQQMFDAKLKKGYTQDLELAKNTRNVLEGVEPMLAFPIEKKEKYVKFPAFVQPKLDGSRCLAIVENFVCVLYSRTQKVINTLPHINQQITDACIQANKPDIILDGELYSHKFKDNFNKIMSLIKRDEVHKDSHMIEYHIYDEISEETYHKRVGIKDQIMTGQYPNLIQVTTKEVQNMEELREYFHKFLDLGYEGAMYRNPDMPYEHKRSVSLLKVKVFEDAEFVIVGVNEGKGKLAGKAGAFECITEDGKKFKAKLKGNIDKLSEYLVNFNQYNGKMLTVQFQGKTPDGIPRFPVGLRIREEE